VLMCEFGLYWKIVYSDFTKVVMFDVLRSVLMNVAIIWDIAGGMR
jgi:hypothetical protein